MSAPTKGSVAGQPIQTGELTKDYEEGFDRTFGARVRARGRFRWNEETKQLESVDSDYSGAERRAPVHTEEIAYGGLRATDGADISSRRKHREYMKTHNLSHVSDFKEHWPKMQKERERVLSGEADTKERKEILGRAMYEARSKRR